MLKKTITYTDYEGVERTEDFYFNLTKAELIEMNLSEKGGLEKKLQKITAELDGKEIITVFKSLILKAYGEKSADGKRFVKSEELSKEFSETPAYDALFMELVTDADAAAKFVNGIVPADISSQTANAIPAKQ